MKKGKTPEIRCSFCGAGSSEVNSLIEGGLDVYICDKCVDNASQILKQNHLPVTKAKGAKSSAEAVYKPSEIKAKLDEYVVGQDNTKKILSVAVYNHYKRIKNISDKENDVEIEKSNVLLLGPTGTGKTLLARTLAKILHVPFAIADATTITEAGYVGDDVETVLLQLIQNSDYDVVSSQRGIIYIDEIDKISRRSDSQSITRDVSGEGVQQALLKMLEGTRAGVPPKGGRKHPEQSLIYIDTKNILFICGGAFDGLEKIIANRMRQSSIGFTAQASNSIDDTEELLKHTEPDDLIKYGFIPELVGRLPIITSLQPLSDEALMNVLVAPKNAIVKQYKQLFDMEDVELEFEEDALHAIVAKAKERKTGARALRSIVEEVMLEIMYELPDRDDVAKCIITKETITENAKPRYELKSEQKVG